MEEITSKVYVLTDGQGRIVRCEGGYTTPADDVVKGQHYTLVQELAGKFREVHGALTCRELLNRPGPESPIPDAFNAAVYASRPCARFVGTAARILEEYMAEHPPKVR